MRKICVPLLALAILALALPVLAAEAPASQVAAPAATAAAPVTEGDLFSGTEPALQSLTPAPTPAFVPCLVIRTTCEPCPHGAQQKTCYESIGCPKYCTACSDYC